MKIPRGGNTLTGTSCFRGLTSGFTLIEVMVSVVILSVGLVVIHQALGQCLHVLNAAESSFYERSFVEEAVCAVYPRLWESTDELDTDIPDPRTLVNLPAGYNLTVSVEGVEVSEMPLDRYTFTLSAPDGSKQRRSVYLNHPER